MSASAIPYELPTNLYGDVVGADAHISPLYTNYHQISTATFVGANVLGCPKRKQSSHRHTSVPPPLHKEGKIKAPLCKGSCHESD